jgi:hypothetical protein
MSLPRWLRCSFAVAASIPAALVCVGLRGANPLLVAVGCSAFVLCFYLSFPRLVCPRCSRPVRVMTAKITHCMYCGAPYTTPDSPDQDS